MKKLIICVMLIVVGLCAAAQIGVGVDLRLAPWGTKSGRNIGSDITVDYKIRMSDEFSFLPTVGVFYENMYCDCPLFVALDLTPGHGPGSKFETGNYGYRMGVDIAALLVRRYGTHWYFILGPRYGYALAQESNDLEYSKHTFDVRVGLGYTFDRWTVSLKCDIALLKLDNATEHHQATALVIGIRRSF